MMKEVEYLGNTYEVPVWTNFIAADAGGEVWAYECRPDWVGNQYQPSSANRKMVGYADVQPPP